LLPLDPFGLRPGERPPARAPAPSAVPAGGPLWSRAARAVAPLYRAARSAAARLAGEERLGRLLHPLKERAIDASWRLDALESALRSGRLPLDLQPLLTPSARVEKRLLDALPVQLPQLAPG
jgi:hypothetical protein